MSGLTYRGQSFDMDIDGGMMRFSGDAADRACDEIEVSEGRTVTSSEGCEPGGGSGGELGAGDGGSDDPSTGGSDPGAPSADEDAEDSLATTGVHGEGVLVGLLIALALGAGGIAPPVFVRHPRRELDLGGNLAGVLTEELGSEHGF